MSRGDVVIVCLFALSVGACSREAPLPPTAQPVALPPVAEWTPPPKPDRSDADAAAILAEALKAHTGGQLAQLEKFKNSNYTRSGLQETNQGSTQATWVTDLSWPGRYRLTTRLAIFPATQSFGTSPKPWRFPPMLSSLRPDEKQELDDPAGAVVRMQVNEDAFVLLFPLADARTVVKKASPDTVPPLPSNSETLHVWSPALDYALVSFDRTSRLMVRFMYRGLEFGNPNTVVKSLSLDRHEEFHGVRLPVEVETTIRSQVAGRWTTFKIEPGKIFPDSTFERP